MNIMLPEYYHMYVCPIEVTDLICGWGIVGVYNVVIYISIPENPFI